MTPLVKCEHCGAPIRGMSDSVIVVVGRERLVVCKEREVCVRRADDARRLRLGMDAYKGARP